MAKAIHIRMGGYGPATTGFSRALRLIGDRLTTKFGGDVAIEYLYNIMDLGHHNEDILGLVENGALTLGYQSSSYMTERVPELGILDLPFVFANVANARAAMDGALGRIMAENIEQRMNYRILGYFENGFRHVSNRIRPIRSLGDMKGLNIRVLPSKVQARMFELLGAEPKIMDLTDAIRGVQDGRLDAQENPFTNTVTYGVHNYHRFHTATSHFYVSRPICLHRDSFDAWPKELQNQMRQAVAAAVTFQRERHLQEEELAAAEIRDAGGEILQLTPAAHEDFVAAVSALYEEARRMYDRKMLALIGL